MAKRNEATSEGEIIRSTNDLRSKVRELPIRSPDDDPVRRAEAALHVLSRHFEDWMEDEVATIAKSRDAWAAEGMGPGEAREVFFRAAHDLKGQAATLGYPLAAHAAGSLCLLMERWNPEMPPQRSLIDSHVEAIRAIFREGAKDTENKIGSALVAALDNVTAAYIKEHGLPEADMGVTSFD